MPYSEAQIIEKLDYLIPRRRYFWPRAGGACAICGFLSVIPLLAMESLGTTGFAVAMLLAWSPFLWFTGQLLISAFLCRFYLQQGLKRFGQPAKAEIVGIHYQRVEGSHISLKVLIYGFEADDEYHSLSKSGDVWGFRNPQKGDTIGIAYLPSAPRHHRITQHTPIHFGANLYIFIFCACALFFMLTILFIEIFI